MAIPFTSSIQYLARYTAKLARILLVMVSACFCYQLSANEIEQVAFKASSEVTKDIIKVGNNNIVDGSSFYQALVAEIYNQSNRPKLTLQYYLPLALKSSDAALVKRVTEIATGSGQLVKGLMVAKHWVELRPDNIEARQYLTLLLLRDEQLKASAEQLQFVRNIIERNEDKNTIISNGLKFIGALLVVESQHGKAYQVFNYYLKKYGSSKFKDQQNLISASLAMEAKKYNQVITALEDIENNDSRYFISAAIMKTKALKKLGKLHKATDLLKRLVKTEEASDSLRLDLVRSLISVRQEDEASQLLNKLIVKHPDNFDLLKSLIALDISQKKWKRAKINTNKLNKSEGYQDDASYFFGEIFKAQSNYKRALQAYKKVRSGSFLKESHKQIAEMLVEVESFEAAQSWLQIEQKKSLKIKDQAHWLKLEADLLANTRTEKSEPTATKKAIGLYDKIILLMPNKMSHYYYRALLYERINLTKSAERDLRLVIKKSKKPADALNALGYLLVKHTSRFSEAKKLIQKALTLKPNDPAILDSLGWVNYKTGKVKLAEGNLHKAYKLEKSPQIASHLITVLAMSGKHQEASAIFNKMINAFPDSRELRRVKALLH